ncbi:MAG: ABC transporter permease [Pseudanabaenaceae cyanobacterium bins.68]|nr:ABC transporter permease [Pseudanabaenaceae cyanobacterium bins.68]
MLTLRHISIRYKQTVIGIAWVLIQPLVSMTIFTIIFGNLVKIPSDSIPYPIFSYSALVLWGLFSESISRSGASLISESKLITKVYFPRLIIPLSAVGSAWIDFVISLFLLLPLALAYGMRPTWQLLLIPLVMVVTMLFAAGVGMILAALNARYRDFQYIIPFLIQVWLYGSPVVYSVQIVPPHLLFWYYLNPMAGLLDTFRFAVTGQTNLSLIGLGWSISCAIATFSLGTWVFRAVEKDFADYI